MNYPAQLGFDDIDVLMKHDQLSGHDIKLQVKDKECIIQIVEKEYKQFIEAIKEPKEKQFSDVGFMLEGKITYHPDDKRFNNDKEHGIIVKVFLKIRLFGSKTKDFFFHLPKQKIDELISDIYDIEYGRVA